MQLGRRTRAAPPPPPPWFDAASGDAARRRAAATSAGPRGNPRPSAVDHVDDVPDRRHFDDAETAEYYLDDLDDSLVDEQPESGSDHQAWAPPPEEHGPGGRRNGHPHRRSGPSGAQPSSGANGVLTAPAVAEPSSNGAEMARHPLPAGHWVAPDSGEHELYLPSSRAADDARIRTTVDRPVGALRPVGHDEARQLAECFAMDYLSCDEDDPDCRRLALEPYLARRSDALLGWPAEKQDLGRWRAVHARAGEVLPYGHGLTVDVKVLVEIFARTEEADVSSDPAPDEAEEDLAAPPPGPRDRPELPLGARWSSVPAASAPGWTHVMTIWQRLGIPVRRHDLGHLVVELFALPDSEGG